MTNTYAINTTRNKEFEVAEELDALGAKTWVPKLLCSRRVKEKAGVIWYDRAYVPKLIFAVFPAVYWRDVVSIKHIIGKPVALSRSDLYGNEPYVVKGTDVFVQGRPGLETFKKQVEAEYADMAARRENSEWVCAYEPGQALQILQDAWGGMPAVFQGVVRDARYDHPVLSVSVNMMGQEVSVNVPPLDVAPMT